jgi:post-segregation antitoxin (ccd killing protein)
MPKMQVYLPSDLYDRVKARGDRLNVSSILQGALEQALAELERRDALDAALRRYESRRGRFSQDDLAAQEARDRASARRPSVRRRERKRAA